MGGVKAHTGEEASEAATAMGAEAFATGNDVAFGGTPSLHTAAHEAAHVVQQRSGVHLKGGVGEEGDPHERHADQVADAVVAGRSAEPLLDQVAGAHEAGATVQRRAAETKKPDTALQWNSFLATHHRDLFDTLTDRLAERGLPPAGAKLMWKQDVGRLLGVELRAHVENRKDDYLSKLDALSRPGQLASQLLALGAPPAAWDAAIGTIIAIAFDTTLIDAVKRMGRQLQIVVDKSPNHALPPASSLVPTYPIDLLVGPFVVSHVTSLGASHQALPNDAQAKMYERGVIAVTYEWVKDPALWNWIHVVGPQGATVEDVAHTPFIDGNKIDNGEWAYKIAARPPYFGIPIEIARRVAEPLGRAPDEIKQGRDGRSPDVTATDALDQSSVSDSLALAQAGAGQAAKRDGAAANHAAAADAMLGATHVQLDYLGTVLERWRVKEPLAAAVAFLARRTAERGTNKLAPWEPVLRQQQALLRLVADQVTELGERDPKGTMAPVREVINAFAHVIGVSHLPVDGAAALADAVRQRGLLPVAAADEQVRGAVKLGFRAPGEAAAQAAEATHAGDEEPAAPVRTSDLLDRAAAMRRGAGKRGAVDGEAAATLELDAAEFPLKAELRGVRDKLHDIVSRAHAVGIDNARANDLPTVLALPDASLDKLDRWLTSLDRAHESPVDVRRNELGNIANAYADWRAKTEFEAWIKDANAKIADEQFRNLLASLAKQLAIMVVTGQVASAAVAGIRGALAASEILSALREANVVFEGMEILIQTGLQTGLERLDGGTAGKREFAENLLAGALTTLALRPFRGLLGKSKGLQQELKTAAQKATKLGVEVSLEFGAGAAAGDMAHRLMHNGEATSIRDGWVQQLVGIGVMKFVGARTAEMHERLAKAVAGEGDHELTVLRAANAALEQRASKGTPDHALELLIEQHGLVLKELAYYKKYGHNDERAAIAQRESAAPGAEFADAPLRLAKLTPLVDGHAYQGREADVKRGIDGVKASFPDAVATFDAASSVWHIKVGERTYLVYEIGAKAASARDSDAPATHGERGSSGETTPGPNARHLKPDVPREVAALREIAPNKFVSEAQNLRIVHAHYEGEGAQTSAIEYDFASGTAHFEYNDKTTGTRTRVEAAIRNIKSFGDLHGAQNEVVGHPIKQPVGLDVIERLNRGDASALKEVGVSDASDAGKLPHNVEFGLGELRNSDVVLVIGEPAAVDWSHLPGMTPRAHTHPPTVNDIPVQASGSRAIPLSELVMPKPDPFLAREVVFPSGADFIVMAHQGVDGHIVVTEFVLRDGMVMKAAKGDNGPRLIFTILGAHSAGAMPDGRKVYKSKVVGHSGAATPIEHDVWVVAQHDDANGNIFMTQPVDMVPKPGQAGTRDQATAGESTSTGATKNAAERGVPKAPLTATEGERKQTLMKKWRELGVAELGELVKLRQRAGETTYEPETPEHKLDRWQNTDSDKEFDKWSPVYHRNIRNSKSGLGREADLRERLDNGNGTVASRMIQTERGPRQVDAAMPSVYIQLKSGDADLTRKRQGGQLSNLEAIQRDRLMDKPVVWVVEGKASQQLRDMLAGKTPPDVKLEGVQGKKMIELFEGEKSYDDVIAKYGLPKKDGTR